MIMNRIIHKGINSHKEINNLKEINRLGVQVKKENKMLEICMILEKMTIINNKNRKDNKKI